MYYGVDDVDLGGSIRSDMGLCDEVFRRVYGADAQYPYGGGIYRQCGIFSGSAETSAVGHRLCHVDRVWDSGDFSVRRIFISGKDVLDAGRVCSVDRRWDHWIKSFGKVRSGIQRVANYAKTAIMDLIN